MSARGLFARAVLYAYPSEFRSQFGDQVIADIEEDPSRSLRAFLDLLNGGIAMRFDAVLNDLRYAMRRLRAAPLFVAIVVLTFALGIGVNVGIFSVLNGVLLRPLPYLDPSGIVSLHDGRRPSAHPALSIDDVTDLRSHVKSLATIAAVTSDNATYTGGGKPVLLQGLDVMPEYFSILGVSTELGRPLAVDDARPGMASVVISDAAWRKYFGADPAAIGKTMVLSGTSYHVVGVTKPGQLFPDPASGSLVIADYIEALPESAAPDERTSRYLGAIARIAPGQSRASVNAELQLASKRLQKLYPHDDFRIAFHANTLAYAVLGDIASTLWIAFGSVIGVLLIACANVANLLGARWSSRDREFGLRRALGASWRNIARQLFVETSALALLGGVAGVLLAYVGIEALRSTVLPELPRGSDINIDGASLLYAVCIVVATALLAGLSPIAMTRDRELQRVLKTAGRGGGGGAGQRLRSALVVTELGLALALVVMTGLMVRSFISLVQTPLGVRTDGVLVTNVESLPAQLYPTLASRTAMQNDLLQRLRALPGVDSAALTVLYPLGNVMLNFDTAVFGESYANGAAPHSSGNDITPGYFRTMGIPLLRGRDFSPRDSATAPSVAIVNQTFVRDILHGRDALGTRIRVDGWNGTKETWSRIVGVVGDERTKLSMPVAPIIYSPMQQAPSSFVAAVIHGSGDRATLAKEIQSAFAASAPSLQAPDVYTMAERLAISTKEAQVTALLLGGLSAVALLLALAGIFGMMSFVVTQRIHEFGIRIAHGASAADIIVDVLRRAAVTTLGGIALGIMIASLGARAISPHLHDISPFDPLTFGVVTLMLFACACAAALQPAIRATRVEPAVALRYE